MSERFIASTALLILIAASASAEERAFPAKLAAQALNPANTIIAAPTDAPEVLETSGKFTVPDRKRAQGLGTVPGMDGMLSEQPPQQATVPRL